MSPLREEDLQDVISIIGRSRKGLPFERTLSIDELRSETLKDPDFRPEGSWVVREDGEPIAFAAVIIEESRISSGLDDAYVDLEVVPEARGKDLEQRLMGLASEYVRSRGVGKARARCIFGESWRMDLLTAEGFHEAHRVYYLVRRGREDPPEVPTPEGIRLVRRPCKECGDEELTRIVEAFNDTFQDHFSFAPEPPERFMEFRDVSLDPMTFSLAMAGDDIVGVCLSDVSAVYNRENGTSWGWVNVLGVRPPYRRRGLGRFLLADGMRWLLEQGMDTIHIGVYAENEKALDLYRSVGFENANGSYWFEKKLV